MDVSQTQTSFNNPVGIDVRTEEGLRRVQELLDSFDISPDVPADDSLLQVALSNNIYTYLTTGEDTNGQYVLFDSFVPPGGGPSTHLHTREDEVFYVVDGTITFQVGTEVFTGTAGDLIPYTRGQVHAFRNLGSESARLLLLAAPAGLEQFFLETGQVVTNPAAPIPPDNIPRLVQIGTADYGLEFYPEAFLGGVPADGITLYGDDRSETIFGSEGSDIILGRQGDDQLNGGAGNDTLIAALGQDTLDGGLGDDRLSAREGNDTLTGGGDRDTFVIRFAGGIDSITDFGGVGTGIHPSSATIAEIDILQFEGPGLTARNMALRQAGDDLSITFAGVQDTGVVLQDFALQDLDNLSPSTGNILFDGQAAITDSFDVFNANQQRRRVFNRDQVTFLNDLDNDTRGFHHSDDVINGQGGNDKLSGRSGEDLLRGQAGDDTLNGGAGNDTLDGGAGNDKLIGGKDDDILNGGAGNDRLTGGKGADVFVLNELDGLDTILDFEDGIDRLSLDTLLFEDLAITQSGNNTLLSLFNSNEHLAILTGVAANSITSADFNIV